MCCLCCCSVTETWTRVPLKKLKCFKASDLFFFFSSLCLSCPNLGGSSRNSTVRAYLSFAQGFCRLCAIAELWTGNSTSCLHPAGLRPGAPPVPPGSLGSPLDADFPRGSALTYSHLQHRPDVTPVDNWSDNWSLVLDRKDGFCS